MNKGVIIGIDAYADAPLRGCVNDAEDFAACLSFEQYDFDSVLLRNGAATRSNILQELHRTVQASEHHGKGSTFMFYFAGHGQVIGQGGYLVTHDAKDFDPGISLAQLAQIMESASSVFDHVIAILDCCHSGSAFTWTNSRPLQQSDIEREVQAVNESRCVLAACRPEEVAIERDGHGVFTQALTEAMLDNAVDWYGNVTLMSIYEYIVNAIPKDMQTPVFKGDISGTVVLGSGFEPRRGRPIERNDLARIISKAQGLVDRYYYLQGAELTDRGVRLAGGARKCALELEDIVTWFDDTEKDLPEVGRDTEWGDLARRVREFRKNLSEVDVGEETGYGKVVRHIGNGGFGHVWEVETEEGEARALKIFHGNELDESVKVQRFTNGYHRMRKLKHPRIVRVHGMTKAPLGFLMDCIQGVNLREWYIDRDGNTAAIMRLMIDICETVRYAHTQGVRHRDIKPENIIVTHDADGEWEPYLTDFDLAYHETNRTMTANFGVGGVINYAAPEQFYAPNAKKARSETVDVFSLAQLLFFVLIGRDPSPENFAKNKIDLTRELSSRYDDRASGKLLDLYEQATARIPENRLQTVAEFIEPLREAESIIQLASGSDDIPESDFWRSVGQLYAGLGKYDADEDSVHMASRSGQMDITGRFKSVSSRSRASVDIEFSVNQNIPVPTPKSGKSARDSINAKLDKVLFKKYGGSVKRHSGNKGTYQVFVTASNVSFHRDGVNYICEIIADTINAIESW